jgi:transposase-like protein
MTKAPTLRQFLEQFQTEDSCLDHLFQVRYGHDFKCPKCERPAKYSRVRGRRAYQCNWCANQLYPTAGTPFDRTRTSLRDWFTVMFLFCTSRHGVAAKEVQRQIGVTYKTAWRMCHEIRKYMAQVDGDDRVGGHFHTVEVDETLVGGEAVGKGKGYKGNKTLVVGLLQRGGDIVTRVTTNARRHTLHGLILEHVRGGSTICTDEAYAYQGISERGFRHLTVNHGAEEYARKSDGAGVNAIEGFWSHLKRSISGTHIHVSGKHLAKYLGEFEYRWNMRAVPHLMLDRLLYSFTR